MSTMVDLLLHPFTDANPLGLVTAPGLSWIGSAGIIVVTLAVLTWMAVKVWKVRQPLTMVTTELQKLRHQHSVLDAEGLNRLDGLFDKVEPLAQAWEEFRETVLVKEDSPGKSEVYNTRPAEEFFTEDNLINQRINLFFYSSFPGIVTGIGLLLTFLAIFAGLLQVNIDEESSRIDVFIPLLSSFVCEEQAQNIQAIVIEGHTDPTAPPGKDPDEYNIPLSQDRARSVMQYSLDLPLLSDLTRNCFLDLTSVNGRGRRELPPELIGKSELTVQDYEAMRRVVFKIRIKSTEQRQGVARSQTRVH